jgi:DNA-binding MarR family transcriptional regulator
MTLNQIIQENNLTELEVRVLKALQDRNKDYFGEYFSDTEHKDLAQDLDVSISTVKGAVGSLVKKGIVSTYHHDSSDCDMHFICFKDQEEMTA